MIGHGGILLPQLLGGHFAHIVSHVALSALSAVQTVDVSYSILLRRISVVLHARVSGRAPGPVESFYSHNPK